MKKLLNHWMEAGYAYTTVKKTYVELKEFFRYLVEQEVLEKSPMDCVPMMKKANFFAAQGKEDLPTAEAITVFTLEKKVIHIRQGVKEVRHRDGAQSTSGKEEKISRKILKIYSKKHRNMRIGVKSR